MVHNAANIRKQMRTGSQVGSEDDAERAGLEDDTLASDKMRKLKPGAPFEGHCDGQERPVRRHAGPQAPARDLATRQLQRRRPAVKRSICNLCFPRDPKAEQGLWGSLSTGELHPALHQRPLLQVDHDGGDRGQHVVPGCLAFETLQCPVYRID